MTYVNSDINVNASIVSNVLKQDSLSSLVSGSQITTASDDVATSGISDLIDSQIRSLSTYMNNISDGISMLETAEAGLQESTTILQEIRELVLQTGSGILTDDDRATIQQEINKLREEYNNIAASSEYNGINLLDGSFSEEFLSLNDSGEEAAISIEIADIRSLLGEIDVSTTENAEESLEMIDEALNSIQQTTADLGAIVSSFDSSYKELETMMEKLSEAESQITDIDYSAEISEYTKLQILQNAGLLAASETENAQEALLELFY